MPLQNTEEVLTSKILVASAPLDGKTIKATLVDRDLIPDIQRFHGMKVFVQEDETEWILSKAIDLTNTGWIKASGAGVGYLGQFDPNVGTITPNILRDNNDDVFKSGDWGLVTADGFWNFTTGDQSPDGGTDHTENLLTNQKIIYNASSIWEIEEPSDLVTSVNGKQGIVELVAADINIDSGDAGLTATETQGALKELKTITDGLSGGAVYLGAFDPNTPGANPPTDGDTVNYNQGDFGIVSVAGFWNFTTGDQTPDAGGQNVATLAIGDQIRFNATNTWDVIIEVGLSEAPQDGKQYIRKDGAWAVGPGGGVLNVQVNSVTGGQFTGFAGFTYYDVTGELKITHLADGTNPSIKIRGKYIQAGNSSNQEVLIAGVSADNNGSTLLMTSISGGANILLDTQDVDNQAKFSGTNSIVLPVGTVAQRPPTPIVGMIRYNADNNGFEGYSGASPAWGALGGGSPAGNDTELQLNNAGAFGANSKLTYDGTWFRLGLISGANVTLTDGLFRLFGSAAGQVIELAYAANSAKVTFADSGAVERFKFFADGSNPSFINLISSFGFGTATPNAETTLDIVGTNSIKIPIGTTAQRPTTGAASMLRYNSDLVAFEGYNGTEWGALGGAVEFTVQTITHAADGTLSVDFSQGEFVIVNLEADVTAITFANIEGAGRILFIQDAIGGRVVNFVGHKTIDGAIPDYSTNGNAESLMNIVQASGVIYILGSGNMTTIA